MTTRWPCWSRPDSALLWAVRSARVFNFMTPDEAAKLGITEDDRRRHVRIANGKANMGPLGKAEWIKIEVENLPNGDEVACSSRWIAPNLAVILRGRGRGGKIRTGFSGLWRLVRYLTS